ncbi:MAG: hypothetical protein NTY80_00945 [candidate division SR1 bacterium]|nr:hypothetical protein [candidate division SR1 bacterium]
MNTLVSSLKKLIKNDLFVKIILLFLLLLVVYYFFTTGYRADEGFFMMSANYVSLGLRPYVDFWGTHGEIGWYVVASLFKSGIPPVKFIFIYRIASFILFTILTYNLVKVFNKRNEMLLFGVGGTFNKINVILITVIISFCLSYSALLPENTMIPLLLLGFYFLIKGGLKNHIFAGIFFAFSFIALQKALFVIPLLYIFSLEKSVLKSYKQILFYWFISGITIISVIFLYVIVRYHGYTGNELWIVYGSLFKLQGILQAPFNLYGFFTGFSGGGINNLLYLLPGIFFLCLCTRKAAITMSIYVLVQLFLLSYIFDVMPLMIVRYLYAFLVLTPIFFRYSFFKKNVIIKYGIVLFVFMVTYMAILLSGQWNKLWIGNCEKTYEIFNHNYDQKISMFYDGICFKHSYVYDMNIAGKRLELEKNMLDTFNYDMDIRLAYPNATWKKIQTLPSYLQERFSSPGVIEKLLNEYPHVYTMFSGCDAIVKIGSYDQMVSEFKLSAPPISCVPLVHQITTFFK